MKRLFLIFLWLLIGSFLGFGYREIRTEITERRQAKKGHIAYLTHPAIEKKPFVVVISANNEARYLEQNILSVLNQNYEHYRIIYIDNESTDLTEQRISRFLLHRGENREINFVKPEPESSEGETLYRAIHSCKNHEIVVLLRGNEFFAQETALETLNHYFADPNIWMITSNELLYPNYKKINSFCHYQSFYAGLFKQIKLEEFLSEGKFRMEKYEQILPPPLIELSGSHAYRIQDTLFICQEEKKSSILKKSRFPHRIMKENPWHDDSKDEESVDLLVFSYNRPMQLYAFLESAEKYLKNTHRLYVLYRGDNDHYERGYREIKKDFPNAIYIRQPLESLDENFASTVRKIVFDCNVSAAHYITFALDDFILKEPLDLNESARLLKETGTYGFYFCLGNHLETHPVTNKIFIQEGVYGWQFSSMENEWKRPNSIRMTLFKKEEIYAAFLYMEFHNPNILQSLWNEGADLSRVGLYYDRSKAVSLPLNISCGSKHLPEKITAISKKELLSLFEQGLKMDISPLDGLENRTVDILFRPDFIKR